MRYLFYTFYLFIYVKAIKHHDDYGIEDPPPQHNWEEPKNRKVCFRIQDYYKSHCFDKWSPLVIIGAQSVSIKKSREERLRVACRLLTDTLQKCLIYFNELCSFKYQKSFGMEIEFTSISLGIATRAALRNFVDEWRSKKLGSDIRLCTSYGGQCEAPDHLELCSEANTPLSWAIFPSILVNIIVNYIL
ncbi:uncharacterized protein [Lepeophtheirus salmonis]|uniref:uncharacterized protein isoform X2 n=1 Tax=Lepeophtheirus salmonis TaxID=72036 RepID=UPI001AE5FBDD|nr:uncharacterized protein LOC121115890 isoform X2 [Lepeophtheirus salmonis]